MRRTKEKSPLVSQAELLGAALRYCAVADWFEAHPSPWRKQMTLDEAMAVFNRVEVELRAAAAKDLRQHGHRDLILHGAGVAREAR